MGRISYRNFDLRITPVAQGYHAVATSQASGQATHTFTLSDADREAIGQLLPDPDHPADHQNAKPYGARLFALVFDGDLLSALRLSLAGAQASDERLRIRLNLTDAPDLAPLPWEYLYDQSLDRFLALAHEISLVRYLDLGESEQPLAVAPPLRILALIAGPHGYPPLDKEREWRRLRAALHDLEERGVVVLERVTPPTLLALHKRLTNQNLPPCHVFHFTGHGRVDPAVTGGVLIAEDEDGEGHPVKSDELGMIVHNYRPLRLALLNACDSAGAAPRDPFAGTAQHLVRQGIPAVAAMRGAVSAEAARTFAHEFYAALADGHPVDTALTVARTTMRIEGGPLEWGTPVLYLRATDGYVVTPPSEEQLRQLQAGARFRAAKDAMITEDWAAAIEQLDQLLGLDPQHPEAKAQLRRAQRQHELATRYASGLRHAEAAEWRAALEDFRRVQVLSRSYKDVLAQVERCQRNVPPDTLSTPPSPADLESVIESLCDGKLVPFLGMGVNLCGRPPHAPWERGKSLPSSSELAAYLAERFRYPEGDAHDLVRVSQYITFRRSPGALYDALHEFFSSADCPPTPLHRFFASLPALLRERGSSHPYQLLVTTNYDDLLEQAFKEAGEPYDLVWYVAEGEQSGKFWLWTWPQDGEPRLIDAGYVGLSLDQRSVILKIHGAVDRVDQERDSYLVTEDHYIDYLTSSNETKVVPTDLQDRLIHSDYLFLGYSMRNWHARVTLHRIWRRHKRARWAVQSDATDLDLLFWRKRDVTAFSVPLEEYIAALRERLPAWPHAGDAQ